MKRSLALALLVLSASVNATEVEEVKVYATALDTSGYTMRAGLTNVALLHEYDEKLDSWRYIGYTDEDGQTVEVKAKPSFVESVSSIFNVSKD